MKVSFCEHNKASEEVMGFLNEKYPQIETSLNKCIGECGACGWEYIARVDGKYIECKTKDEMVEAIMKMYL